MGQDHVERALLTVRGQRYEFTLAEAAVNEPDLLEELSLVRREAQAEADIAYLDWLADPSGAAYAVYRAAQDRADAAQDDLADCAHRTTG
jgi:hypothetical protein